MTLWGHRNNQKDPSLNPGTVAVGTLMTASLLPGPDWSLGRCESAAEPGAQPADHRHAQLPRVETSLAALLWVPPPLAWAQRGLSYHEACEAAVPAWQ